MAHEKMGKSISAVGLKKLKVFINFFPNEVCDIIFGCVHATLHLALSVGPSPVGLLVRWFVGSLVYGSAGHISKFWTFLGTKSKKLFF